MTVACSMAPSQNRARRHRKPDQPPDSCRWLSAAGDWKYYEPTCKGRDYAVRAVPAGNQGEKRARALMAAEPFLFSNVLLGATAGRTVFPFFAGATWTQDQVERRRPNSGFRAWTIFYQ